MTPLHSLPIAKRPREKLCRQGVQALCLEELLAVVLRTGSAKEDVLGLSARVAAKLTRGEASVADLASLDGLGQAKAAEVVAALHLAAAVQDRSRPPVLTEPAEVYRACADLLEREQECLVVFYLTVRSRVLAREVVSLGTATASLVHPREVFRPAILHNASHIVLAHNHPSGDPSPSQADRAATRRIAGAGREVGIELVDHVVCASTGFLSLREVEPELFF